MRLYVFILLSAVSLRAQEFVNLTFDDPNLSGSLTPMVPSLPAGPLRGQTADLLRGWILLGNGQPLSEMTYSPLNTSPTGPVTLEAFQFAPESPVVYQLELHSRPPSIIDFRLMQTGRIPDNAAGLTFFANGRMEMLVNGELLHWVDINDTVFPTVDVSRFAGQVVNLEFHVAQGPAGASFSFDIAGFTQIPEPATWALFGAGAAAMGWMARRRK